MDIIVINNKYYYYYESYKTIKEAIDIAVSKRKKVKRCRYHIIKTVDGWWNPTTKYRLYLSKIVRPRFG